MNRNAPGTIHATAVGGETVRAFIPSPLPPVPALDLSGPRQRLLERATLAVGRLDSVSTWVDFFLEAVEQTALGAVQTARRLVTLFEDDTRRTQAIGRGAANALRVLAGLRQRPILSLKQLCHTGAMTFPTASKAMQYLVTAGIARELTGQRRNRVFVYDAYLKILNEGGEPI